ncbi:hypothetical protein T11_11518 [Trichinella zimbabwensis]|uniref:Uncharacterized protein n=1 Tax=Trichinella zimbabwensis TaxID=268475 RepID=A0A0V1HZ97_9BILA|nr:hypothetical protein T11_11518 [Trichinella zimbabwensis]
MFGCIELISFRQRMCCINANELVELQFFTSTTNPPSASSLSSWSVALRHLLNFVLQLSGCLIGSRLAWWNSFKN